MKLLAVLLPLLLTVKVSGFASDGTVEIIFPQAIRFTVNLTVPASDLTSAELTISPARHAPITVEVDLTQAGLSDNDQGAQLTYLWRMTVDDPPPLFGTVDYHWSVTAADGSVGTLDDSFVFSDPRVDWVRSLDAQGDFNVSAPRSLSPLLDPLQQVHALLEQNTGQTLPDNLLIYPMNPNCVPSSDDPPKTVAVGQDGTTIPCDAGIEDVVFAGYDVLVLAANISAEDFTVGTLVNRAYAPLWQGKNVPGWFANGLEQFYAPTAKSPQLAPAQQAARSGSLLSLDSIDSLRSDSGLRHAQSFGMVVYIADRIGYQGLYNLARVDAADFNTAYQVAMGAPISALIPAWGQWIFSPDAETVYGITPYQPPTATPSATPTASATPTTTQTATLTPTVMPTLTATPPGFRTTYVPPPTVTPSQTLTALPATVTPRPPDSLPTITPTPTALQAAVAQPGVQVGAATFLILLLVLLVYLLVRLGMRR